MADRVDALTGLGNAQALQEELARQIATGENVAVAVLDIDRFLEINTDFGHEEGDRILVALARALLAFQEGGVFRVSGDEFAAVMPGYSLEQAFLRMEALRAAVESAGFNVPDARELTVTIGVAQYPRDARDAGGLLKSADAALLTAKETGRNQVALPPNEEMVMKSCYYAAASVRRLRALAGRLRRKESVLLREALDDLLRKHDTPREE